MIDIAPLRIPSKIKTTNSLESLDDYYKIAPRLIVAVGLNLHPLVAQQILNDEDALSQIITAIMIADCQWNGAGSKYGYRKQYVTWAIKSYMSRRKRNVPMQSLSGDKDYVYTMASSRASPYTETVNKETTKILQDTLKLLTPIQKRCIEYRYFDGLTIRDITIRLKMSRHVISRHIQKALRTMRRAILYGIYERP